MSQLTVSIPRTDNFMKLVNTRMKFLLGNNVTIGTTYTAWQTVEGEGKLSAAPCQAIAYDGQYLYVHTLGTGKVTELMGDMAEFHGVLIADKSWGSYQISTLRQKVKDYMAEHGITEYTSEIGYKALYMAKVPGSMIRQRVHVYEMTRELDIGE